MKRIKLKKLDCISESLQMMKISEEYNEVLDAFFHNDLDNLCEELFDLMQASYTMLLALDKNIEIANDNHLKKIEKYIEIGRAKARKN